jgi:hypothetical protein
VSVACIFEPAGKGRLSHPSPSKLSTTQGFVVTSIEPLDAMDGPGREIAGPGEGDLKRVEPSNEQFLTLREVASKFRVSTPTVYGLCGRGALSHFRVSGAIRVLHAGGPKFGFPAITACRC